MGGPGDSMGPLQTREALVAANSLLQCVQYLTKVEEGDHRLGSMSYTDARLDFVCNLPGILTSRFQVTELQAILASIDVKLKYIANATRPTASINKLPNALLARVFQILVDLPLGLTKSPFPSRSIHWIVVTHVCKHWRELALSTASLWTEVLLHAKGGPTLADAFIFRSGDLPLTIVLGSGTGTSASIPMIQSYCRVFRRVIDVAPHRIARLFVEPGFPIDDVLSADRLGWKLSAELERVLPPFLQDRTSTAPKYRPASTDDPLFTLFHSPTARLTHLELCGGPVIAHTLDSGTYLQHLEILHLFHQDEGPHLDTKGLVMSRVFDMLSASKSTLRKLTLVGVPFPDIRDEGSLARIPIPLDCLEYLEMGDWPSNEVVTDFLTNLRLPRTAVICLWADELEETSSCEFYPRFHAHPEDTRCVVLTSVPGGDMIALRSGVLFINGAIPFHTYSSLFSPTLASVDKLVVTPLINPLNIEEWCQLFKLLPNIRLIEVRDADPGRLLRALRLKPGLPRLTGLDLQYSDRPYLEGETDPLGVEYATEPPSLGALLCSVALQRHSQSSASDAHPLVQRLERVFVRLDGRARAVDDWEPELDAIFNRTREYVGSMLYYKRKWGLWELGAEESERKMEMDNKWHLVMKSFQGFWPTKAVYSQRLQGAGGKY